MACKKLTETKEEISHNELDRITYRFSLNLTKSDNTSLEFNYGELVDSERESKEKKSNHPLDPFGDDDDDEEQIKALAKKFEDKYGSKPSKKSKKYGQPEDFIDLGLGYDDADSFIDNTDAYDELVPSTLTTQHGGFYINFGKLDFVEVNMEPITENSVDGDDEEELFRKRKRKRILSLDKLEMRKKKKFKRGEDNTPKKRKMKPECELLRKRIEQPAVVVVTSELNSEALQKDKSVERMEKRKEESKHERMEETKMEQNGDPTSKLDDILPAPESKQWEANIDEVIESVIELGVPEQPQGDESINSSNSMESSELSNPGTSTSSGTSPSTGDPEHPTNLPTGLPSDLEEAVNDIKKAASTCSEGKTKFFTPEVNNLLLSIEMKTRVLSCSQRCGLYSHLADHLPCSKITLQKRAKKLRLDKEDSKLKGPFNKLKKAIAEVMPGLIEKHAAKCKAKKEAWASEDGKLANDGKAADKESSSLENGDEDTRSSQEGQDKNSARRLPCKTFEWNDHLRKLLGDVVNTKMKCFKLSKRSSHSAEEYIKQFLEAEVKNLWPKRWMQTRTLIKMTRGTVNGHPNNKRKETSFNGKKPVLVNGTVSKTNVQALSIDTQCVSDSPVMDKPPKSSKILTKNLPATNSSPVSNNVMATIIVSENKHTGDVSESGIGPLLQGKCNGVLTTSESSSPKPSDHMTNPRNMLKLTSTDEIVDKPKKASVSQHIDYNLQNLPNLLLEEVEKQVKNLSSQRKFREGKVDDRSLLSTSLPNCNKIPVINIESNSVFSTEETLEMPELQPEINPITNNTNMNGFHSATDTNGILPSEINGTDEHIPTRTKKQTTNTATIQNDPPIVPTISSFPSANPFMNFVRTSFQESGHESLLKAASSTTSQLKPSSTKKVNTDQPLNLSPNVERTNNESSVEGSKSLNKSQQNTKSSAVILKPSKLSPTNQIGVANQSHKFTTASPQSNLLAVAQRQSSNHSDLNGQLSGQMGGTEGVTLPGYTSKCYNTAMYNQTTFLNTPQLSDEVVSKNSSTAQFDSSAGRYPMAEIMIPQPGITSKGLTPHQRMFIDHISSSSHPVSASNST